MLDRSHSLGTLKSLLENLAKLNFNKMLNGLVIFWDIFSFLFIKMQVAFLYLLLIQKFLCFHCKNEQ